MQIIICEGQSQISIGAMSDESQALHIFNNKTGLEALTCVFSNLQRSVSMRHWTMQTSFIWSIVTARSISRISIIWNTITLIKNKQAAKRLKPAGQPDNKRATDRVKGKQFRPVKIYFFPQFDYDSIFYVKHELHGTVAFI